MGNVCCLGGARVEEDARELTVSGAIKDGYPAECPDVVTTLRAHAQEGPLTCSSLESSLGSSPHAFFIVHEAQPTPSVHAKDGLGARLQRGSSRNATLNLPHYLHIIDKLQYIAHRAPDKGHTAHSQLESSPLAAQLEASFRQARPQCIANNQPCMELFYNNAAAALALGVGCGQEPWSSWLDVHVLQNPLLLCQLHRSPEAAPLQVYPHCLPHPHGTGDCAEGGMQVHAITCTIMHPQRGLLPALLIGVHGTIHARLSSPKQLSFMSSRMSLPSQASGNTKTSKRRVCKSMDELRKPSKAKGGQDGSRAKQRQQPINHLQHLQCCALAMAHIPMAVTCVNEAGRIVWQNGRSAELLGLVSPDEGQEESEQRLRRLFSLDPDAWESLLQAIKEGQAWSGLVEVPGGTEAAKLLAHSGDTQAGGAKEGVLDQSPLANPALSACSNVQERSSGNWPGILLSATDDSNVVPHSPTGEMLQHGEVLHYTARFSAAPTPIPGRASSKEDKQARSPQGLIHATTSHPDDLCTLQWSPDAKGWAGMTRNQLCVSGISAPQDSVMSPNAIGVEPSHSRLPNSSGDAHDRSQAALQLVRRSLQASSVPLRQEQAARGRLRADTGPHTQDPCPKPLNLNRSSEVANCSFEWLVQGVSPEAANVAEDDITVQDVCSGKAAGGGDENAHQVSPQLCAAESQLPGRQCVIDRQGSGPESRSSEGPILDSRVHGHSSTPEGTKQPQQPTKRTRGSLDILIKQQRQGSCPHNATLAEPTAEQTPHAARSMHVAHPQPLPASHGRHACRVSFQGASCPQDVPDVGVRNKGMCKHAHSMPISSSMLSRSSSLDPPVLPQTLVGEQEAAVPEKGFLFGAPCRCWHSIDAFPIRGPGPGETLMVLTNQDVSDTINIQLSLQQVLDIEHKLLQEIFPQHVLESQVAAGAEAAMASTRSSVHGSRTALSRSTSHLSLADSLDRSRHGARESVLGSSPKTTGTLTFSSGSPFKRMSFLSQSQSRLDLPPAQVSSSNKNPLERASKDNRSTSQGPFARVSGPVFSSSNERGSQEYQEGHSSKAGRTTRPTLRTNKSFYSRLSCGTSLQGNSAKSLEGSVHGGVNFEVPKSPCSTMKPLTGMGRHHEHVTVMFADVKNFTAMSRAVSSSAEVMHFLHSLFSEFDTLVDELEPLGIFKVETIGDCYMVAGNLLGRTEDNVMSLWTPGHGGADPVHTVFKLATRMIHAASKMEMPSIKGPVVLRIGAHTGPVTSGIAGIKQPRFCLFGDTVNFSARMEATCPPGCVHVSQATWEALGCPSTGGNSQWKARSGVEAKGIGIVSTYVWRPSHRDCPAT